MQTPSKKCEPVNHINQNQLYYKLTMGGNFVYFPIQRASPKSTSCLLLLLLQSLQQTFRFAINKYPFHQIGQWKIIPTVAVMCMTLHDIPMYKCHLIPYIHMYPKIILRECIDYNLVNYHLVGWIVNKTVHKLNEGLCCI